MKESIFIILTILAIAAVWSLHSNQLEEVRETLTAAGYQVDEVEYTIIDNGPFWPMKNVRVIRAATDKGRIYVRYFWGPTYKTEEGEELVFD